MISILGLSVKALKKEPFSGSQGGMRYYIAASGDSLAAYVYPEPWCFEATPDGQKEKKEFPFSQDLTKLFVGSTPAIRRIMTNGRA